MDSGFVSLRMGKLGKGNEDSHDHISVHTDRKFSRVRNFLWIYMLKDLKAEIQDGEHGSHTYPMYSP